MRGGKFPANHPAAPNSDGHAPGDLMQFGHSDALEKFRNLGYFASCFPEGDGLVIESGDKTPQQVIADIRDCFGWEVET
jgi:hypothetical protein